METYALEVITFTADIGQGEETKEAKAKAKKTWDKKNIHRRFERGVCKGLRISYV